MYFQLKKVLSVVQGEEGNGLGSIHKSNLIAGNLGFSILVFCFFLAVICAKTNGHADGTMDASHRPKMNISLCLPKDNV